MAETIDLMGPTRRPVEPLESIDLMRMANSASDGSVTVYSLDEPGYPIPSSATALDIPASGDKASSHSSVEVFPLDDNMRALVSPHAVAPQPEMSAVMPAPYESEVLPLEVTDSTPSYSQSPAVSVSALDPARIFFDHNSTALDSEDKQVITAVSSVFRPGLQGLSVEGHASIRANYQDEVQRRVVNLQVSMNRALAVARELIEGGIPPNSIRTVAWGDTKPVPSIPGLPEESAARRVDIFAQSLQ